MPSAIPVPPSVLSSQLGTGHHVIRVVPHKNLRDANFHFVTLGMQIRQAFSITSSLCLITKKNEHNFSLHTDCNLN